MTKISLLKLNIFSFGDNAYYYIHLGDDNNCGDMENLITINCKDPQLCMCVLKRLFDRTYKISTYPNDSRYRNIVAYNGNLESIRKSFIDICLKINDLTQKYRGPPPPEEQTIFSFGTAKQTCSPENKDIRKRNGDEEADTSSKKSKK